jgi:sulfopyruvate decarboxylase subunit beta
MLRTEAVDILARKRGIMLSIVTMQAVDPWNAAGQANNRNFNVVGCMGSAGAVGFGLALARPHERVLIIDGDGSLLMQLATLVSIAERRPANLCHVVLENGVYQTSGAQNVPGRDIAQLGRIALASGYREAYRFETSCELEANADRALRADGPVFVSIAISGQGRLEHPITVPNKATQIENMRLALSEAE